MTPHPLAIRLIEHLRVRPQSRVLDYGSGSGRNATALTGAGFAVVAIDDRTAATQTPFAGVSDRFTAALSTHGLLHGSVVTIAANVARIAALLERSGSLYATFGSVRDSRFGQGESLGEWTFAPLRGAESGVPHTFFDRDRLQALLEVNFAIESVEEHGVDEIAGSWAHSEQALSGAVHWFVVAKAR